MEESYKDDIRSKLRARLKKEIIQNNIYGVDIEEGAIEIARLRFWLSLVIDLDQPEPLPNFDYKFMQGNSLLESYQFEVESENQNAKPKSVSIDLSGICEEEKVEDDHYALFDESKTEREDLMKLLRKYYGETDHAKKKGLREKIEKQVRVLLDAKCSKSYSKYINAMPLICDKFFLWHLWFKDVFDKGGFDIVIGNPPYIVVQKKEYPTYKWNTDLYKMFFEKGISLLTTKGVLCYITPKFYMVNMEDAAMREYFVRNMYIFFLSYCNPFDVTTENVITMMMRDTKIQDVISVYRENEELKVFEQECPLNVGYSMTNAHKEWITGINSSVIAILSQMESNMKLKDISTSKRGAEISKKEMRATNDGLPSIIGQDMHKYVITWNNTYLNPLHREYRRLRSFFSTDIIYLRRVDVCLEATISDILYGFNKNVYGLKINANTGYGIKFILALLNSKSLDYYYKKKFSTKKEEVFPEIQTYLYEQLPIPTASSAQQQEIITIVDKILSIKQQNPSANTTPYERQIDALVYELYGITSYEELLEIEGDKDKALEMQSLISSHIKN